MLSSKHTFVAALSNKHRACGNRRQKLSLGPTMVSHIFHTSASSRYSSLLGLNVLAFAHTTFFFTVPLGNRRRFGPAPVESANPPQLAQPSPSAYPRPQLQRGSSEERSREQTPIINSTGMFLLFQILSCPCRMPPWVRLACTVIPLLAFH